jgi:hypothetical protein
MNVSEAKGLHVGAAVHLHDRFNADGTPMRARVTSVKTWKTRPEEVEVHVKHGMYDFAVFMAPDVERIHAEEACEKCPKRVVTGERRGLGYSEAKCTFFPCGKEATGKYRGNALCAEHLDYAEALGESGPGRAERGNRYWINKFYGQGAQYDPSNVVGPFLTRADVERGGTK